MKTLATGLLVLLSVLVAESSIAQQSINAPPDTVFYNGKIITVDSDFTIQQAFEKISREEALRIATYNNAFATWEETVKGSIEPGKLADFLVLSGDFMTIPEDEILKLHPMATYVGGRKVYAAPGANGAF